LLSDERVNDFEFGDDANGAVVPLAAHIRKTYPRDAQTRDGGEADTQTHRIMRRGIPFGASLPAGTPSTDPAARPAYPADRGLLFLCYQASISRQFETIQRHFVNDPDFVPTEYSTLFANSTDVVPRLTAKSENADPFHFLIAPLVPPVSASPKTAKNLFSMSSVPSSTQATPPI
jgi:deferrochelatase/peroxidase EfeB